MKKIRFKINYGRHRAGHVIGTTDTQAAAIVATGVAEYVADNVRPLKYAAGAAVQTECVAVPPIEELEAAPKGAVLPPAYETPEQYMEEPEVKMPKVKKTNT